MMASSMPLLCLLVAMFVPPCAPQMDPKPPVYYYVPEQVDYYTAKTKCESKGDKLAMPKTEAENSAMMDSISGSTSFDNSSSRVWIGLESWINGSVFVWGDGRQLNTSGWTFWQAGQPDNTVGHNCVETDASQGLRWNDELCTANNTFVCQSEDAVPPPRDDRNKFSVGGLIGGMSGCFFGIFGGIWGAKHYQKKKREQREQSQPSSNTANTGDKKWPSGFDNLA